MIARLLMAAGAWVAFAMRKNWLAAVLSGLSFAPMVLLYLTLWIGSLPPLPPDPSNAVADDAGAAALGQKIFFDTRFSANGEVACASCHQPQRYFTDGLGQADYEGIYLPDGDIVFVSSRCKQWVPCYVTQVAVLYRCDADGRNILDFLDPDKYVLLPNTAGCFNAEDAAGPKSNWPTDWLSRRCSLRFPPVS